MSARTRSRLVVLVCICAWWTPSIRADPVLYSTSGTVDISNEPTPQLLGVTEVAAVPDSTGQFTLGQVQINPVDGWSSIAPPNISNSPFDLRLDFNNSNLPSLELKGVFNPVWSGSNVVLLDWAYLGTVTSIVSSNPSLNANLPAPFADAISSPDILKLHIGMWDWGVSKLPLTLTSEEFKTIPEPSTLVLFGVIAALGAHHARTNRRHRSS
ncbi:MAG: hypothetical protein P4L84_37140 [Isosphaeraceae bacterium]|nr:hypothetical protein [Isosphaeraceae bacterium]